MTERDPSMSTWHDVGRALLGRWPSQVAAWGPDAIQAFLEELQADGLTPETALVGIRSYRPEKDYPPSVATVTKLARFDPDKPTFDGLLRQLYGPGGVFGVKRSNVTISPWVLKFVEDKREWVHMLPIDDLDEGKWARKALKESWEAFCEATEGRQVHEIASRSARGSLGRPDYAGALGRSRPEIGAGT